MPDSIIKQEDNNEKSKNCVYSRDKNGALYKATKKGEILISSSYIKVTALIRTPESVEWSNYVEFVDMDGKRRSISILCQTLLDAKETLKLLAGTGFSKRYCSNAIVNYLKAEEPSERIVRVKRTGWVTEKEYVCPSFQVADAAASYSLAGTVNDYGFSTNGTLEEWRNNACRYCENNGILTLALCVGLSGVLLKLFPTIGSTAINLVGRSSIGKTSGVAASLWGSKKFIQQWRATSNALEAVAESHNDGLLILDELGDRFRQKTLGTSSICLETRKAKAD